MAAITYVAPSLVTPAGEARIRRGEAAVEIKAGQAVALNGTPSSKRFESRVGLATSETTALGIALKTVKAGGVCEFVVDGEVGGFAGLTAGTVLSVVNGVLNNTAPAAGSLRTIVAYNATTVMIA